MTATIGSPTDLASRAALELLRTALLAKLAVDLQDPALAHRAAREALAQAGLLHALDFPPYVDESYPQAEQHDEQVPLVSLPLDLEQLVRAGHLVEVRPGVFRRAHKLAHPGATTDGATACTSSVSHPGGCPRWLHMGRLPSRAELSATSVLGAVNVTPHAVDHGAASGIEAQVGALLGPPVTSAAAPARGAGPVPENGTGAATGDGRPR